MWCGSWFSVVPVVAVEVEEWEGGRGNDEIVFNKVTEEEELVVDETWVWYWNVVVASVVPKPFVFVIEISLIISLKFIASLYAKLTLLQKKN